MLTALVVTILTFLTPIQSFLNTARLNISLDPASSKIVNTGHQKASATIFWTVVFEGGGTRGPMPVTITVSGKDSELALKMILERLADKPARPKP